MSTSSQRHARSLQHDLLLGEMIDASERIQHLAAGIGLGLGLGLDERPGRLDALL